MKTAFWSAATMRGTITQSGPHRSNAVLRIWHFIRIAICPTWTRMTPDGPHSLDQPSPWVPCLRLTAQVSYSPARLSPICTHTHTHTHKHTSTHTNTYANTRRHSCPFDIPRHNLHQRAFYARSKCLDHTKQRGRLERG